MYYIEINDILVRTLETVHAFVKVYFYSIKKNTGANKENYHSLLLTVTDKMVDINYSTLFLKVIEKQ